MRELLGHTEEARERQGRNTHREREMWGRVGVLVVVVGVLVAACVCGVYADGMPLPFTRVLKSTTPPMSGDDVTIMQNVLMRSPFATSQGNFQVTGKYDLETANAVSRFQFGNNFVPPTGIFDAGTATRLLTLHLDDEYRDDGTILPGYLYKMHIPVHRNRSIETTGTLYDSQMKVLRTFTTRTHGQNGPNGLALNELTSDGSTPTGLATFDLNSPEDDPASYGPYPVNRAVQGLKGNMAFLISNIRNGILMHTGEWPNWNPSMPMPNSHGCVHAHPEDIEAVWHILVDQLGVVVHNNTFGKLPYPYKPQGLLSIELVED